MKTHNKTLLAAAALLLSALLSACGTAIQPITLTATAEHLELRVGETAELPIEADPADAALIYENKDASVVTVDGDGVVTGVGEGMTEVTVSSGGEAVVVTVSVLAELEPEPEPEKEPEELDEPDEEASEPEAGETETEETVQFIAGAAATGNGGTVADSGAVAGGGSSGSTGDAAAPDSATAKVYTNVSLNITNWTIPAVYVTENLSTGVVTYYDSNGRPLGTASGRHDWSAWAGTGNSMQDLVDAFNDYRGVARASFNSSVSPGSGNSSNSAEPATPTVTPVDTDAYVQDALRLVNQERVYAGVAELIGDSSLTSLAIVRAEELSSKPSHERPDGTYVSTTHGYAEIILRGSPDAARTVESWMGSNSHKSIIVDGRYTTVGTACYQDSQGVLNWVMLFSK